MRSQSVVDELSKITEAYDMSLAIGNSKVPTVSDLDYIIRIASVTLTREEDDGLIEYVSKSMPSPKHKQPIVLSLIPGLTLNNVHDGKRQTKDTQLLRSCLCVKLGDSQEILDTINVNVPGPFDGLKTYLQDISTAAVKILSKNT